MHTIEIVDHCNEPMAKHCRLCRSKRLGEMEFRMNNKQVLTRTKIKTKTLTLTLILP